MEDVMLAVSWELLTTTVARVAPLKIMTEDATKWLPVAVMTKLDGSCAKTIVAGEIEARTGAGRALPQRGFSALHPDKSKSTSIIELRIMIRKERGMNECNLLPRGARAQTKCPGLWPGRLGDLG
jgi:hypothetical protein